MEDQRPVGRQNLLSKQNVIIKKIKKSGHEGGHGGSWKVAYADFVTAMMAFFLLLWLLTMSSPEKRARVSSYFKHFSLFEKSGLSFFMDHPKIRPEIEVIDDGTLKGQGGSDQSETGEPGPGPVNAEEIKYHLQKMVEQRLSDIKDQVLVNTVEGSVRVEMMDKAGSPMFAAGSREITGEGRRIIKVIAESIKDIPSKIALEGHTDAATFATRHYSNWELSTERASAARRELEDCGLSPDRLVRVAGYAATEPLVKDNPLDPRNRRISIRLFQEGKAPTFGADQKAIHENPGKPKAERLIGAKKDMGPVDLYLLNR